MRRPMAWEVLSSFRCSWGEDIHEYLEREVKPFVPDAWMDESKTKEGAEIPSYPQLLRVRAAPPAGGD